MPFHVAVAVSPFKYIEADCMYQYLKLEKKIAAGADLAITQVGWDAEKFAELKRYLDERGIDDAGARQRVRARAESAPSGWRRASRRAAGSRPSCSRRCARKPTAQDGGLRARLERAAPTVAVLRGLGYAGAYIGGTHDAGARRVDHPPRARSWRRGGKRWPRSSTSETGGFYLYDRRRTRARAHAPAACAPRAARCSTVLGQLLPVTHDTWLRRAAQAARRVGRTSGRRWPRPSSASSWR